MSSRRVDLRPVEGSDLEHLRRLELSEPLTFRWRLRGAHPHPSEYQAGAWASVLCQFLAIDRELNTPVGLVVAYEPDLLNGHCKIAATRFEFTRSSGVLLGATALLIEHVFAGWPFRKLYFDVPAFNLSQFRSATNELLREEARFEEYLYMAGRFWDLHVLSIGREHWMDKRKRWMEFVGRDPEGALK